MEDYYTHRNSAHRYLVTKVDDEGDIQMLDGDGLEDESHTKIMRLYPHGFSSHSLDEAHFLALALGGRRDMLIALGGEHAKKRPRKLAKGDSILYNAEGDAIRVFKKSLDFVHTGNIKLSIGNGVNGSGEPGDDKDVTIVMTDKDITLTKGESSVKITGDNIVAKRGSSTMTIADGQITHEADKVIVKGETHLGGEGGEPVQLCGGGCATKVFAI
jgi:phage gp45-like